MPAIMIEAPTRFWRVICSSNRQEAIINPNIKVELLNKKA